jgi:hypothetical protein
VDVLPVKGVKPKVSALKNSVVLRHCDSNLFAPLTAVAAQGHELKKADSVALKLKPSTAMERAKREQNEHKLCVDCAL